jgi:hypothetical protein
MTAVYVSLRLDTGEFGGLAPLVGFREQGSAIRCHPTLQP